MNANLRSKRRPGHRNVLLCAAVGAAGLLNSPARGQITFLNSWGSLGTGIGKFNGPTGVAVGPDGTVYVADPNVNRIQYFDPIGNYIGVFQPLIGTNNIAVAPNGNVFVPDTFSRVQIFNSTGTLQGTFGTLGSNNGQLSSPFAATVAPNGTVYVADTSNDRIEQFTLTGGFLSTFGSAGSGNGQFNAPMGVAVSPSGSIYVADSQDSRIEYFTSTGVFAASFGGFGSGNGNFGNNNNSVAVSAASTVYATDFGNNRIETFSPTGTFLSSFGAAGTGSGQFNGPSGIAIGANGLIYAVDTNNNRVQRLFDPSAWVSGSNNFTDIFHGITALTVGAGQNLGTSFTLNPTMALTAFSVAVNTGGSLTEAGGALNTNFSSVGSAFTDSGSFIYQSGNFSAYSIGLVAPGVFQANQGGALTVTTSTAVGGIMSLDGGVSLTSGSMSVSNGGSVIIGNANVTLPGSLTIASGGSVQLLNTISSFLTTSILTNSGLLQGSGLINGQLLNQSNGTVAVNPNQSLTITATAINNTGMIDLAGGNIRFMQGLTNQANSTVSGFGTIRADNTGLSNSGSLILTGAASVFGTVTNNVSATIRLTGNQPNVFFNAVANSGNLTVDSGASGSVIGSYTGSGAIVNNGALFLHANSIAGPISGGGTLTLGDVGSPTGLQLLALSNVSTQGAVNINPGSTIDLANNALAINYGSAANDPAATIVAQLTAGYNHGTWNGVGINSSAAAVNPARFAVGYNDGNNDAGAKATANQLYIEYTLNGDANLNGTVDFPDLVSLAQNFGFTARDWEQGNFNYDPTGAVSFPDLVVLAQNFGFSTPIAASDGLPRSFSPAWQLTSTSPTPEPAALAWMAAAAGALLSRRKSRRHHTRFE